MNECRRSLECINFGSFENCVQEVTIPVGCSHYVKDRELSSYSTAALVAELCRREGVADITLNRKDSCSSRCYGPGKILWVPDTDVVRGSRIMTAIPPVQVRQVRACADPRNECVYYRWDEKNHHWCTQKLGRGIEWRWGNPIKPCVYHLTPEELTAFIDQHNAEEQR